MKNFIAMAHDLSQKSRDPSTKVGAVAVPEGNSEAVGGWNQFPNSIPEDWWQDRDKKYQAVIHAEMIAIASATHNRVNLAGGTMYVTHHPCRDCAKAIIAVGIVCVVCPPRPWRDDPAVIKTCDEARELFEICGVEMVPTEGLQ